jgi:tellurite resistance protein TehA-like permease
MSELMVYVFIGVALLMIAPILITVIVYRDAVKRKLKSPIVWALIAGLIPFYIGLLLYVLIGINQTDQRSQP